jgi:hypothetical protein
MQNKKFAQAQRPYLKLARLGDVADLIPLALPAIHTCRLRF